MTHELKVLPEYFDPITWGEKQFEVRKNDRNFKVGDELLLKEFDGKYYTGYEQLVKINYILYGDQFGIEKDYCVMSIERL